MFLARFCRTARCWYWTRRVFKYCRPRGTSRAGDAGSLHADTAYRLAADTLINAGFSHGVRALTYRPSMADSLSWHPSNRDRRIGIHADIQHVRPQTL
jgi:hypothetical protein